MRMDLISVPYRTMPASNVSSIVKSWRALRLRATVCSSRMSVSSGSWARSTGRRPRAHERRPWRTGARVAYPPTGCPTKRPSPARWCSYAYCRSLHITSFRSQEPYPNRKADARARAAGQAGGRSPRVGRRTEHLEGLVEDRVRAGGRAGRDLDDHVRGQPDLVDPALVRRQPARDRELERPALAAAPATAGRCPCRRTAGRRGWPAWCPGGRPRRSRSPRRCRRR